MAFYSTVIDESTILIKDSGEPFNRQITLTNRMIALCISELRIRWLLGMRVACYFAKQLHWPDCVYSSEHIVWWYDFTSKMKNRLDVRNINLTSWKKNLCKNTSVTFILWSQMVCQVWHVAVSHSFTCCAFRSILRVVTKEPRNYRLNGKPITLLKKHHRGFMFLVEQQSFRSASNRASSRMDQFVYFIFNVMTEWLQEPSKMPSKCDLFQSNNDRQSAK